MASSSESYPDLVLRKQEIDDRLEELRVPPPPPKRSANSTKQRSTSSASNSNTASTAIVPIVIEKTDTHYDFLLKEMQWLAADFTGERKRHLSARRKLALSMKQFFASKESRRLRELSDATLKQKRLAARHARSVRAWWTKLERVISYKQKVSYDTERRKAMNQQLVSLVKTTEKYTDSLARQFQDEDDEEEEGSGRHRRRRRMSVEEALSEGLQARRSKTRITDYARMNLQMSNNIETASNDSLLLYGESTASENGSDSSYAPETNGWEDDESTMLQAEQEETMERRRKMGLPVRRNANDDNDNDDDNIIDSDKEESFSFQADPVELQKLKEESRMGIQDVIARLQQEGSGAKAAAAEAEEEEDDDEAAADNIQGDETLASAGNEEEEEEEKEEEQQPPPRRASKRVKFSRNVQVSILSPNNPDPGEDADDDADASDVEDFMDVDPDEQQQQDEEEDEEFVVTDEVDDETTMEQEESLPREMSYQQEIELLEAENAMSVEELRKKYGVVIIGQSESTTTTAAAAGATKDNDNDDDNNNEEEDTKQKPSASDDDTEREQPAIADNDKKRKAQTKESEPEQQQPIASATTAAPASVAAPAAGRQEVSETAFLLSPQPAQADQDSNNGNDDGDEEFLPNANDLVDDETTIEAEERLGRDMSYEEEVALLNRENDMSIEELRALYNAGGAMGQQDEEEEIVISSSAPEEEEEADEEEANDARPKRKREEPSQDNDDKQEQNTAKIDSEGELSDDAGRAALDALEKSAERARRARATRPFILAPWVKLREYQQVGLNWLVSLHSRRLNGVLADQMGLGKTLQTIALLAYLAAYKGIWGPHLIVVPTSVLLNWETEFKRFCPALKVLCYYGPAKRRKELRSGWTKTNWYHVVITSYQLVVQDAFAFKRKKWYYLVLDEAQNIKNFQSQRWQTLINFNTQRRLLLTGTPLQNNLMELWSLLHFLMPYIFRSRKEFSYWFANPMTNMIEGARTQNDDVIHRLHGIIRPFVLRRLKKDVEQQLPGKFEHVIKCQLSRRQMFIYEEFLARSSTRQALAKGGNFLGMMNVLMQLRKVCNHPDLFEPRSVVTPFVADSITFSVSSCIVGLQETSLDSCKERVSSSLLHPLWCGSSGLPSTAAAIRHDGVEADELCELMETSLTADVRSLDLYDIPEEYPPALKTLLYSLNEKRQNEKKANLAFLERLNSSRCRSKPFAYPKRLVETVTIEDCSGRERKTDILSTPSALLAMRRNQQQMADRMDDMIKKFVFCVPSASARRPVLDTHAVSRGEICMTTLEEMLLEPLEEILRPFRKAQARLSSSFPDKALVQFDAGKLQTLAELLRELKRGGHRVLIFTQMSKILDILEAFLNLNGHTYLRLDGSTGVERRQRLMDRFNSDPKVFCFILSTRSGGLGINLTGADTVVFYDQDWNPAMDAQAQDRAHRIGQTREVHIYRLITEHTIEENILLKAQQKRNLDILVMDQGKFDASQLFGHGKNAKAATDPEEVKGVYTAGGLRAILGAETNKVQESAADVEAEDSGDIGVSNENMDVEKAMASLEDVDDVQALRGAQKEADDELREFDESAEVKKASDSEDEDDETDDKKKKKTMATKLKKKTPKKDVAEEKENMTGEEDGKQEEEDLEKEFAAWQDKVGMDANAIEASLTLAERYGLRFREEIDPFYSIFAVMEYRRKIQAEQEVDDEVDVAEIEREKALEEKQAIDDGDLLATRPRPENLIRQAHQYRREKARLSADKKRRRLTGENWESRNDALSNKPFWYNIDTGEAIWDKPSSLFELEAYEKAQKDQFVAMPLKPLIRVMGFLSPFPDRMNCAAVCRQWQAAATDPSFVQHVYPVEMGAYTRDDAKIEHNHYRSISDALACALPGGTIELSDGHYWEKEDLVVEFPLRLIGDEHNPAAVVVEMSGTLSWRSDGGWMEGVTFRRPKMSTGEPLSSPILSLGRRGRLDMVQCVFDNKGSGGDVVNAYGVGNKGKWEDVLFRSGGGGLALAETAALQLNKCVIKETGRYGLQCCDSSEVVMTECEIDQVFGVAIEMTGESRAKLLRCRVSNASGGVLKKETGCTTTCNNNTFTTSVCGNPIPGFRQVD